MWNTDILTTASSAFFWYSEYILDPNGFPNMAKKYIFCFMFHWIKNFIQVWKTGEEVNYGKIYLWSIPLMLSIGAQHWFPMKLIKDFWWKINYQLPKYSAAQQRLTLIIISAVKRLIAINRIQNKSFCLHNMYIIFYKNTHACIYLRKICYVYILNIFLYDINLYEY